MVFIKTNALLRGADKTMSLEQARLLRLTFSLAPTAAGANARLVEEETLATIERRFGETGLFRLMYMMATHDEAEFQRFLSVILLQSMLQSSATPQEPTLDCDNARLPQGPALDGFNSNVLQPSLARKLYNPGRHPGFLVYGLNDPNILVSHPFRNITGETYGVYKGSGRIVEQLLTSGYVGSCLFLDYLGGLNFTEHGQPAWLLWFSIIAAHSDVVLFVREEGSDFTPAQRLEIEFTPDRVQKKIFQVPVGVLEEQSADRDDREVIYITGTGDSSKEKFEEMEGELAAPLIHEYGAPGIPHDRLFRLDEAGQATSYPLDFPIYDSPI